MVFFGLVLIKRLVPNASNYFLLFLFSYLECPLSYTPYTLFIHPQGRVFALLQLHHWSVWICLELVTGDSKEYVSAESQHLDTATCVNA